MATSFNEAVRLRVAWAWTGMFEAIFTYKDIPFFGIKGCPLSMKTTMGVSSKTNSSVTTLCSPLYPCQCQANRWVISPVNWHLVMSAHSLGRLCRNDSLEALRSKWLSNVSSSIISQYFWAIQDACLWGLAYPWVFRQKTTPESSQSLTYLGQPGVAEGNLIHTQIEGNFFSLLHAGESGEGTHELLFTASPVSDSGIIVL